FLFLSSFSALQSSLSSCWWRVSASAGVHSANSSKCEGICHDKHGPTRILGFRVLFGMDKSECTSVVGCSRCRHNWFLLWRIVGEGAPNTSGNRDVRRWTNVPIHNFGYI